MLELERLSRERQRLLARLVGVQEEERRLIASEIHDSVIQKMIAAGMRLELLERKLADEAARQAVANVRGTVRETTSSLRHLMFELRPYALDRDGLGAALEAFLEQERALGGETVYELEQRLSDEPPEEVRTVLYRIVQEAAVNARKHARASRISLCLRQEGGAWVARVVDDGIGFSPSAEERAGPLHLGLSSMRERAALVDGTLRIETAPGEGTTVEVTIPASG